MAPTQLGPVPSASNSSDDAKTIQVPDAFGTTVYSATSTVSGDVEKSHQYEVGTQHDPFKFRKGMKTEDELEDMKKSKAKAGKKLSRFHKQQNQLISSLLKPIEKHTEDAKTEEESHRLPVKIAIYASLFANLSLCVLQLYAAASGRSLSLLATGIDAVFDLGSNVVLFWAHRTAQRLDINKWPVGGSRLETIGNVIYGSLMSAVNLVVVVESMQDIFSHKSTDKLNDFHIPSLVAVGAALAVKFVLFLYCFAIRNTSSQVRMLWEDHRNDLWINSFGILMSAGGSRLRWWLDPVGAITIALGVIAAWTHTIYHQFELLAGKSAPHEFIQLIIYKAMTFSDEIEKIDTVRAYHSGPEYFVEVDVVMTANTPLWKAHDLSQKLQDKIEILPNVGRAFVHVDHETTHVPEHRKVI